MTPEAIERLMQLVIEAPSVRKLSPEELRLLAAKLAAQVEAEMQQ